MSKLEERGAAVDVSFALNGKRRSVAVRSDETLLETLRGACGVTSVRGTCGIGVCGTCTVLVDGGPVSSCITLTPQVRDQTVTTAEGLPDVAGELSPVQQAFVRRGAYQCSFCIPAMTLAVHAALRDPGVDNTVAGIREYLAGNLCRCGSYPQILQAVTDLVSGPSDDKGGEPAR